MATWRVSEVKEWLQIQRIYSLFMFEPVYNYRFSGEVHNFWEFVYVCEGTLTVTADAQIYHLSAGDMIFHKPMEFHNIQVENPDGATLLLLAWDGLYMDYFKGKIFSLSEEQREIMDRLCVYLRKAPYTSFDAERKVYDCFTNLKEVPTFGQMVSTYFCQILLSLMDCKSTVETTASPETLLFKAAANYMNSQIERNPSVEEIVEYCNSSKSGLGRIFKKYTGLGIHKYFMALKLHAASEMLKEGLNVTMTAEKLGFSSQAYFSAVYKREFGIYPTEMQ